MSRRRPRLPSTGDEDEEDYDSDDDEDEQTKRVRIQPTARSIVAAQERRDRESVGSASIDDQPRVAA